MSKKRLFYGAEPKPRKEKIEDLIRYLKDPARFSILLLGKRGTGKSHWLQKICKHRSEIGNPDCLKKTSSINGIIAKDYDKEKWQSEFEKSENGLLIVDDVEELSKTSQAILFEFLSTTDGKYGYDEKKFECRVVFTSSFQIKTLRDTEQYLSHRFYDRISQLVVELPSFEDFNRSICEDFKATWKKMKFPIEAIPNGDFSNWLKEKSHRFHGNFRDLDKLAINWRNCQIAKMKENEIFGKVTKEFFEIYHFPKHESENENAFFINEDQDFYKEMQPNFRNFVREYAKKIYGKNLSKAPNRKPFGVPWRTMDRW